MDEAICPIRKPPASYSTVALDKGFIASPRHAECVNAENTIERNDSSLCKAVGRDYRQSTAEAVACD